MTIASTAARSRRSAGIELLYCCPSVEHADFVRRLRACAGQFRLAPRALAAPALARRCRFAAFISATQPTVVLVRGDDVVGQTVGPVPASELHALFGRAALA